MSETPSNAPPDAKSDHAAAPPAHRLFLERRSYRQRRLADALRLIPILAAVLWMVPMVWPKGAGGTEKVGTSNAALYVFGIWFVLIVFGAILALRMGPADAAEGAGESADDAGPPPSGRSG